jgi:hypothetical protein
MLWYRLIGSRLFGFRTYVWFVAAVRLFVPGKRDGLIAVAGSAETETRSKLDLATQLLKFYRLEHLLRKRESCQCDLCLETERLLTRKAWLVNQVAADDKPRAFERSVCTKAKETEAASILAEVQTASYGHLRELRQLVSSHPHRAA